MLVSLGVTVSVGLSFSVGVSVSVGESVSVGVSVSVGASVSVGVSVSVLLSQIFISFSKWEEYLQETHSGTGSSSWDLHNSQFVPQFFSVKSYFKNN